MTKSSILLFILMLSFGSTSKAQDQENKEVLKEAKKVSESVDDPAADFKETKFLQVDRVLVPKELEKIEDQVRQNILDVILISKTHTPIYSQKRDGYSDSYKKFYGLQVTIAPAPKTADTFEVSFSYYNWTTNKFDKSLYKRISKYNVLNELRFGMYELLFGKDYVSKNRDVIDVQNYERIQAVRKAIAEQQRFEKKKAKPKKVDDAQEESSEKKDKKKIIREDKEKEIKTNPSNPESPENDDMDVDRSNNQNDDDVEVDEDNSQNPVKAQKVPKNKNPKSKKGAQALKESSMQPSVNQPPGTPLKPMEDPNRPPEMKYISQLSGLVGLLYEPVDSLTSDKKIKTYSNFKYFAVGGKFEITEETKKPLGYLIGIKLGIPVMKENYTIPMYKSLDVVTLKHGLVFEKSKIGLGLQYSPVNFVNVPDFGGNLQVFENNIFWVKGSLGYATSWKSTPINMEINAYLSLLTSSNQKKSLSGSKVEVLTDFKLSERFGFQATGAFLSMGGDLDVTGSVLQLFGTYYFEN